MDKPATLPFRNDTMLGVCEGLGQDLGIHPNLLRIAFASAFYFSPVVVIATYLSLGLLVAAARWAFPDRKTTVEVPAAAMPANESEALAMAA